MNENICMGSEISDHGTEPLVVDIERITKTNHTYRTALWTGNQLQVTVMSIPVGENIGFEMHPNTEQFIRVESGCALAVMGQRKEFMSIRKKINSSYAVIVPAGTWHNIINIGNTPLKLYSIYAPVQHPFGTIHETKKVAELEESI